MKLRIDAVYAIVSVPCTTTNPSYSFRFSKMHSAILI
jgi:hypothetical protein